MAEIGRIDWIYSYGGPGMEGFEERSDYLFLREIGYILTSSSQLKRNWGIATKTRFFILVYKAPLVLESESKPRLVLHGLILQKRAPREEFLRADGQVEFSPVAPQFVH